LYPLEKSFLVIQKPPVYFSFSEIASVTFSRVTSAAASTTKMCEMKFMLTSGVEFSYSSIPREEHGPLESYCRAKKLSVTNEIEELKLSYAEGSTIFQLICR
jgi:structure-specific recognition protein 1